MNETQALLVWTFCGDAAVGHDDDAALGIVGAALGRIDRAVDLHVRRHRLEGAVGSRIDRQAEAVADEERLRLACGGCCASSAPAAIPIASVAAPASQVVRFMSGSPRKLWSQGTAGATVVVKRSLGSILVMDLTATT